GPDTARGMLQAAMEADRRRQREEQAARGEIGLYRRADRRNGRSPDSEGCSRSFRLLLIQLKLDAFGPGYAAWGTARRNVPQTARLQGRDHVALVAACMAVDQHLALHVPDR